MIDVMTMPADEMMGRFMMPSKKTWSRPAVRTMATVSARFFEIESM